MPRAQFPQRDRLTREAVYVKSVTESQDIAMDVLSRNFETCNESGAESQLTMGKRGKHRRYWSRGADLNRRPADYESAALPTELPRL